jgi:O-antigen/teichoic acid export membrane protein
MRLLPLNGRRFLGSFSLVTITRVSGLLLGVIATALVSRSIGPAAYADFALAVTLSSLCNTATDFGLSPLLVREIASTGSLHSARTVALTRTVFGTLAGAVSAAIAVLIAHSQTGAICCLIILATAPAAGLATGSTVAQALGNFGAFSLFAAVQSIAWTAVAIICYLAKASLTVWAIGFTGSSMLTGAVIHAYFRRTVPAGHRPNRKTAVRLLREGVYVATASLVVLAYHRADYILVYRLLPATTAGQYAVASRFLTQALIIPAVCVTIFAPQLASRRQDTRAFRQRLGYAVLVTAAVASVAAVALALAADLIVRIAYGSAYTDSVPMTVGLSAALVPMAVALLAMEANVIIGNVVVQLRVVLVVLVVNLPMTVVGVKLFGTTGAIVATIITEAGAALSLLLMLRYALAHPPHSSNLNPYPEGVK